MLPALCRFAAWERVMGKRGKGELVLVGGRVPHQRKARSHNWTKTKARLFIEALADSCNVTLAAEQAGVSVSAAYRRRAIDAGFRAAWRQALSAAYARLEMMMLERALNGIEKVAVSPGGESRTMRDYADRTALALLKMHRDNAVEADQAIDPQDHREAVERILARLARLRTREGIETKGLPDRLALIRWARRAR